MTAILANTTTDDVPGVLRHAADIIDTLPLQRVGRVELHCALRDAAPTYQLAQAALEALAVHLHARTEYDVWLYRWADLIYRADAAAHLRAAAAVTRG